MTDDLHIPGVSITERYIQVAPGVSLRLLDMEPEAPGSDDVIVFLAGWFSIIEGWLSFIERLTQTRRVIYVETREKRSSRLDLGRRPQAEDFALDRLAEDLAAVARRLELKPQRTVLVGSSLGATVIHRALSTQRVEAKAAVLIAVTVEFRFPRIGQPLLRLMPAVSWLVFRPITLWYLRRFRVDAEREPEQMRRYEKTLGLADPVKIKLSSKAFADLRVKPAAIDTPILFAYAGTDKLHGEHLIETLAEPVPRATMWPCPSNQFMHEATLADRVLDWIDGRR